jgi:uncharacterized protein (TIGR00297 family)
VHVVTAAFALLLRYLTWPEAAALAIAAIAFNTFALARVAPEIIRDTDARGPRTGILFYPLSVLLLVLTFRQRLDIVAGAWGIMAFGDGFATLVGTTMNGARLPWNPQKSWNGLIAFIAAGSVGAVALMMWTAPAISPIPPGAFVLIAPIVAAIVAGLVETIPIRLDDNISVPAAAGAVLWLCGQIDQIAPAWLDVLGGVIVTLPVALVAWRFHAVTRGGAAAGFICALLVYLGSFLAGLAVLGIALILTIAASRVGRARKAALGIAEERRGQRGAGNILANCGVGAVAGLLAALSNAWSGEAGALMLVAAIAAGASDTVASEIGKAYGRQPRAFPSLKAVPPGTPGAVSIVGTLAGVAAAVLIAWPAFVLWLLPSDRLPLILAACILGSLVESTLATTFEPAGILDNNTLNFINTATAAAVSVWWASPPT